MSINPQAQGHDMFDVLEGSVTNHFAAIESVLLKNEAVNGRYDLTTAASYASNTPVDTPGFTKVCISTNGSVIADLENSYIEADIEYTLKYTGTDVSDGAASVPDPADTTQALANSTPLTKYFIGFKQSLDALERYDIYCNSQLIYSQPFVGPESTVLLAGINDTIRDNSPFVFTSYGNASTMDNNVCGVYVDIEDIAVNTEFTIKIPVKINIHQFLLLSPIHYLPSFCGKWEIQLYFGSKNLVMCPVNPLSYFNVTRNTATNNGYIEKYLQDVLRSVSIENDSGKKCNIKGFSSRFTQINCPMYMYKRGANGSPDWVKNTFTCSKAKLTTCLMNITQFQLKYEIYQALLAKYTENPLIIPTNTLSYQRFAHSHTTGNQMQSTANLPVENIDALYVLIPELENQQTCFYQPYLTDVRMSMGEFGIRPARYMSTFNDGNAFNNRRFITYLLDALNLEDSQISAMSKDFSNSVMPHAIEYASNAAGDITIQQVFNCRNRMNKQYDDSQFMIGIPCSHKGFQSGTISSPNCNINFQFDAIKKEFPPLDIGETTTVKSFATGGIIVMFLTDAALMIQPSANSDLPLVRLSSKSIV